MNTRGMTSFLTEDNVSSHISYMKMLRCKYSLEEKSFPQIKGKGIAELSKASISAEIKREMLNKLIAWKSHELYFSSFALEVGRCEKIKKYFSSTDAMLYEIENTAQTVSEGFVYVSWTGKSIKIFTSDMPYNYFVKYQPQLALDLCEHSYFLDYRFNRESYVTNALAHLNISVIDDLIT